MYLYRKRKAAGSQVNVLLAKAKRSVSIYNRRYRLTVRKELLRAIVLGDSNSTSSSDDTQVAVVDQLAELFEEALNDPKPQLYTQTAKILVRYSLHVSDYFKPERIAPLQPALLSRLSLHPLLSDQPLWTDTLESEILKSYDLWVKVAALEFILERKKTTANQQSSSSGSFRFDNNATERHRPMSVVQRSIGRKLCIHHFYGRRFVSLWYKHIRPVDWRLCLKSENWELADLSSRWQEELNKAQQQLVEGWNSIIKHVVKYAQRNKVIPPSEANVEVICRTLDALVGLLLVEWRQENMTNFIDWLTETKSHQMVMILHVSMNENGLEFSPSVDDVCTALTEFCKVLSVAAYNCLVSTRLVFQLMKEASDPALMSIRKGLLNHIRVETPCEFVNHVQQTIRNSFSEDQENLKTSLAPILVFAPLLKDTLESMDDFEQLKLRVEHYRQMLKKIELDLPRTRAVGSRYLVQLSRLKSSLRSKVLMFIDLLLVQFNNNFKSAATTTCKNYAQYADTALTVPQTTAQWIEQRDAVESLVDSTLPQAYERTKYMLRCYFFMCDEMLVESSGPAANMLAREVIMWRRRMSASLIEHGRIMRRKRIELEEALKNNRKKLAENVTLYSAMVDSFQRMGEIDMLGQYVEQARSLLYRLDESLANVKSINQEEAHFLWEITQYPLLGEVREQMTPFLNFFEMSSSFLSKQQQWLDSRLGSFDPDAIVRETETFAANLSQMEEHLPDIADVRHLLSQVQAKLREFNKVLPLIRTLGNPALRERHWEQIWDTVGVRLSSEAATSLQQLLALQLNEHLKKIEVVSHSATQEMALENALIRMKTQWTPVALPVESYRVGEGKVLGTVDSIQLLVEDHMMETSIMRRSPYVKPFEKDAKEWEQQLSDLQVLLEQCVFIQERWYSLEPLLTSPDVLSVAPDEARKFSAIDKNWREVLLLIGQHKQIFSLVYAERMTERLVVCMQQIEQLEKQLHGLMESKRIQYPRFFLLAEDELRRLLSLSRDPQRLATNLWRLYDGVHDLEFHHTVPVEGNTAIVAGQELTHVISAAGERLALKEPVSFTKCKGQLDKFLNQLEAVLKATMTQVIVDNIKDFNGLEVQSLAQAPSQVIVLAVQIFCTGQIDAAFEQSVSAGASELGQLLSEAGQRMDLFIERLRNQLTLKASSEKVPIYRLTAESIALAAMHYTDLLDDMKTSSPASAALTWESWIKFRWIEKEKDRRIQVQILDMEFEYGMEYMGRPARMMGYREMKQLALVVSSALHRQLTGIVVTIHSQMGAELLDSLSQCLGQRLVRLDCSSRSMNIGDILRYLRGATTCGMWLCYEKIDSMRSSVAAYMTSLLVQLQNLAAVTPPWLEMADTGTAPQYGVFALANSFHHLHRKRFEPNLNRTAVLALPSIESLTRVLFPDHQIRAVVDSVDDSDPISAIETVKQFSLINSISGEELSRTLLAWQSARLQQADQLSGIVKKLSKLLPQSEKLSLEPAAWRADPIVAACPAVCQQLALHFSERISWKLSNLADAYRHPRLPVLVCGSRLSGKTTLINILIHCRRNQIGQSSVSLEKICIGAYDPETLMSNATDAIIPQLVHAAASLKDSTVTETLIVLDGLWMTGVHDVLIGALSADGHGVLCLPSGEQIVLPSQIRWCFEMRRLDNISPGQVAQCRVIHLDGRSHLNWQCLVKAWLASGLFPPVIVQLIDPLLNLVVPAVLERVDSLDGKHRIATGFHPVKAVKQMLALVRNWIETIVSSETLALIAATSSSKKSKDQSQLLDTETRTQLQAGIIFSILWTLAVPGYLDDQKEFNEFFHSVMEHAVHNGHLFSSARPPNTNEFTVFDYKLVQPSGSAQGSQAVCWQPWGEELVVNLSSLSRELAVNELFIPTAQSVRVHHLLQLFIQSAIPCVLVGAAASGKTSTARHYLRTRLNKSTQQVIVINASSCLDGPTVQRIIMGQMERRRRSVYGPTLGKKAIIFLDDMHSEALNCSPKNRLAIFLRQCIQNRQIFDGLLDGGGATTLIDIDFVATTAWTDSSEDDEVLQSFAPIVTEPPSDETTWNILNRMLMWHLDARGFAKEFDAIIDEMINASAGIYRALIQFQSTSKNSASRWNLRDLFRCVYGLLLSVPETIEDVAAMKRLWLHESLRSFSDPLPPSAGLYDTVSLKTQQCCEQFLNVTLAQLFAQLDMVELADLEKMTIESIFFCDFSDPKSESRSYLEVMDMEHLARVVRGYITEYNNMNKKPMHYLTAFKHVMRSISKACRVIKQPAGHLMLVGRTGVGRHSLARIAGHACDCLIHHYECPGSNWQLTEWVSALKMALVSAAEEDKRSIFICSDAELERPECRALINHVTSGGDIMHLFDSKERHALIEQMRAIDLQKEKTLQTDGSAASLKSMFETRMWEQIRFILVASDQQYARPQLLNECPQFASACQTVWLEPWPSDAVEELAAIYFKDLELEAEQSSHLMTVIKIIHESTTTTVGAGDDGRNLRYGLLVDFIQVAVSLTRHFRQELKTRQELCIQAGAKLEMALKHVQEMESVAQGWKDSLGKQSGEQIVRTERDVELIETQIDRAKDLLSNLDTYRRKWSDQVGSLESRIRCCPADSALTAGALVFGAELNERKRIEAFGSWIVGIDDTSIITFADSSSSYTTILQPELDLIQSNWIQTNLPRDGHCIRSALALKYCVQRVPLLVDPFNLAERWIDALNAGKENRPTHLHMSAPDYLEQLAGALQLGTVVVIDVTQTPLDPSLVPVLLKQTFSQGPSNYVKLGEDVVEYAGEFQLYLRSQLPVEFNGDFVTVIDLSLEYEGVYDYLVSTLVNSERPDTEEKIQLVRQMTELCGQLDETEQSLLNILSQSEAGWIENDQVITSLLPGITQSKLLKEKLEVLRQTGERMETQRQTFAPTAQLVVRILSSLWRLQSLYGRLHFTLQGFGDSVVACLEDGGDGEQADDLDSNASPSRKLAARLFNRKLKSGLDRVQRLLVALLLAYSVAHSEGLCSADFIRLLATGKFPDNGTKEETESQDWDEFVRQLRKPENRYKLSSLIETISQQFFKTGQRVDFGDYCAAMADVSSVTPLLLFVEPAVDLLAALSRFCREFDFPEDRVRFAAVAELDQLNWVEVEDCVRRGNWLVLQGFAHLRNMVNNMRMLLEHLAADNISPEFKLFIIWEMGFEDQVNKPKQEELLPRLLMENCRPVYLEQAHTAEDCFQEFTRSPDFDRLMNDPLRGISSYQLKLKTAALLGIFRLIVWNKLDCLIPVSELWAASKLIALLVAVRNHDWSGTFTRVVTDQFSGRLEPEQRHQLVDRILPDLVAGKEANWNRAVQVLVESWASSNHQPIVEYIDVAQWLADEESETRRQTKLSQRLWELLECGFTHKEPINSMDLLA